MASKIEFPPEFKDLKILRQKLKESEEKVLNINK